MPAGLTLETWRYRGGRSSRPSAALGPRLQLATTTTNARTAPPMPLPAGTCTSFLHSRSLSREWPAGEPGPPSAAAVRGAAAAWQVPLRCSAATRSVARPPSPADGPAGCLSCSARYNYFSLSRSMTLYLTEEFGVSDYRAGTLYGAWGTLLTAYGFLLGGAIDVLGALWRGCARLVVGCQEQGVERRAAHLRIGGKGGPRTCVQRSTAYGMRSS